MFKRYATYRNWKQQDVDMLIVKQTYSGPAYVKLNVHWVLRRDGSVLTDPARPDKVRVKREHIKDWAFVY